MKCGTLLVILQRNITNVFLKNKEVNKRAKHNPGVLTNIFQMCNSQKQK